VAYGREKLMPQDRMERLGELARLIQEQWKLLAPGRLGELTASELELCAVRNKRIGALLAMLGVRSRGRS
jgi:hypothetical protein